MKRKVIQHGPSTLTVSLPSKWVKSNNVFKGDELNVEEEGRVIKIYPGEAHLLTKKAKVDFSGVSETIVHIILAVLHKSGYDELEVTFDHPKTVKTIRERINSMLIGYEIIDQKGSTCVIKNVSGDHIYELDALIRRSFLVMLSLANNSFEELKNGRKDNLEELLILEQTSNKLVNYCQRLLNKTPYKDASTIYTYVVTWLVESVCDDYRDLLKAIIAKPSVTIRPAFIELMREANELLEQHYDLFYGYSDQKMASLKSNFSVIRQKILRTKFSSDEQVLSYYLFSIINRVYDCIGSTVGLHH